MLEVKPHQRQLTVARFVGPNRVPQQKNTFHLPPWPFCTPPMQLNLPTIICTLLQVCSHHLYHTHTFQCLISYTKCLLTMPRAPEYWLMAKTKVGVTLGTWQCPLSIPTSFHCPPQLTHCSMCCQLDHCCIEGAPCTI
jgi:hypothetical protein